MGLSSAISAIKLAQSTPTFLSEKPLVTSGNETFSIEYSRPLCTYYYCYHYYSLPLPFIFQNSGTLMCLDYNYGFHAEKGNNS